jgi:hypothetical protein
MELNVFKGYPTRGIACLLNSFGHEQYPSNNVNPWRLIIKYHNEGIGFLVSFSRVMQYPSTFQNICYGAQCIYGIPFSGYCMFIESF